MTKKINCPDKKWFQRLALGQVSTDQERMLSDHLDNCARCQNAVESLNDLSRFTTAPDSKPFAIKGTDSASFRHRLESIKSQRPEEIMSASPEYKDVLPWLESTSAGQHINEFEIQKFIGRGGMGIVFKCHDTRLERPVALKLMSPQLLIEAVASERFLREARSAARINHPNVVTVHAVNESKGLPFLVMELIEGHSLEDKLKTGTQLTFTEILQITKQVVSGLAAAHQQGVLHRDIKPANIMFDKETGNAKITDFGLACSVDGSKLTRTGLLVGTPEYLSPEQASGAPIDERSDLFSLGSVIYAMCCGKSPFSSSSMITTLDNVRALQPQPIQHVNKQLPKWFVETVNRLLQKDPELRFASAVETLSALNLYSHDSNETIPQIDLTSTRKIIQQKHSRQNKYLRSMTLVAMAALLVISTVFWWFYSDQHDRMVPAQVSESTNVGGSNPDSHGSLPDLDSTAALNSGSVTINTFEDLVAAIHKPFNSIEILINADSIIEFEQSLEIDNKHITISAPDGSPAILRTGLRGEPMIRASNATLVMENVTLELDIDEDWDEEDNSDEHAPMVSAENSQLEIVQSRMVGHELCACLELDDSAAKIVNTQMLNSDTAIIWMPDEKVNLELSNSIILAPFGINAVSESDIHLIVDQSTIISESALVVSGEFIPPHQISMNLSNSVLLGVEGLIHVEEISNFDGETTLERILQQLEVSGENNLLPPQIASHHEEDSEISIDFASWESNLENSTHQVLTEDQIENLELDQLVDLILDGQLNNLFEKIEGVFDLGAKIQMTGPR